MTGRVTLIINAEGGKVCTSDWLRLIPGKRGEGVDDTTVYNDEDIKRNTKVEVVSSPILQVRIQGNIGGINTRGGRFTACFSYVYTVAVGKDPRVLSGMFPEAFSSRHFNSFVNYTTVPPYGKGINPLNDCVSCATFVVSFSLEK